MVGYHCLDVGCGRSPSWETDSFLDDGYEARISERRSRSNDTQSPRVSFVESANSESNRPLGDLSLEVNHDTLSDLDTPEQVCYFSEGRNLLLGV